MKKNIISFASSMIRIDSVINVTMHDGRVEFMAHKSVVNQCFHIAFINDMYVSVYSVNKGYYQMAAHLNLPSGCYEDYKVDSEG